MLGLLGKSEDLSGERQKGFHGAQSRDHGRAEAERIVALAEQYFELQAEDWTTMKKSDWRKGLAGGLIRERALIDNRWLTGRLHMGARNAVSRIIRRARELEQSERKVKQAAKALRKMVCLI